MLLFNSPAEQLDYQQDDPATADYWESWRTYMGDIYQSGIVQGGNALKSPTTATTVRVREGERQVQDGPFADTRELLGGYLVIEVPSLDDAIAWAERSPSSKSGSTEIRPVLKVEMS